MSALKLVIAAEIFSPNLGDGVIFDCLSALFRSVDSSLQITPLDISGRQGWRRSPASQAFKYRLIALGKTRAGGLYSLANWLRLTWSLRRRTALTWKALLEPASGLVIGGGQLLMDNHLDFPVKLYELSRLAADLDEPLHLTACGVGLPWSPAARRMFTEVVQRARTVSLRDQESLAWLNVLFPQTGAHLTCDPAIWAAEVYGKPLTSHPDTIGLGVINPLDARLRGSGGRGLREQALLDSWLALVAALERRGWRVELFTNGSLADESFARRLLLAAGESHLAISLAPRAEKPRDLAHRVAGYAGVVAARLHASLLAASYRVPCVALSWDDKVRAFYEEIGLLEACFPVEGFDPEGLADRLATSVRSGGGAPGLEACKRRALGAAELVLEAMAGG